MLPYVIDIALGLLIGLTLGLLGGGGSILTVPALVYIVGQPPQTAVTASLVIVGSNAVLGAWFHRNQGTLNWRIALLFGGVGMLAAYASAGLSQFFAPTTLMIMFALLMLVVGGFMIFSKAPADDEVIPQGWLITVLSGLGVGLLTGLLGVGGGFLIVPALVMLVGLPMRQAVGTSLVIIAMNSLAGFLGHLSHLDLDPVIISLFVVAGLFGAFLGARLARVIDPARLRLLFAIFVVVLALALLYDNVSKLLTT